jgi:FkbM family methyltransferase
LAALSKIGEFLSTANALGRTPGEKWGLLWRQTKNIRVRMGLGKYLPDNIYELETRFGRVALRDNFGDITNLYDLWVQNVYRFAAPDVPGDIFDVGANIGLFAAFAAHHAPGRTIHCFEPLSSNARMIPRNCPRAVVNRCGVGREPGRVRLGVDEHGIMASSVDQPWPLHAEEFDVVPLDDYTRRNSIEAIAFIKIDCEGMELDVLDGAAETLRRTSRVAMETHGLDRHRGSVERLRAAGFTIDDESPSAATGMLFASRK